MWPPPSHTTPRQPMPCVALPHTGRPETQSVPPTLLQLLLEVAWSQLLMAACSPSSSSSAGAAAARDRSGAGTGHIARCRRACGVRQARWLARCSFHLHPPSIWMRFRGGGGWQRASCQCAVVSTSNRSAAGSGSGARGAGTGGGGMGGCPQSMPGAHARNPSTEFVAMRLHSVLDTSAASAVRSPQLCAEWGSRQPKSLRLLSLSPREPGSLAKGSSSAAPGRSRLRMQPRLPSFTRLGGFLKVSFIWDNWDESTCANGTSPVHMWQPRPPPRGAQGWTQSGQVSVSWSLAWGRRPPGRAEQQAPTLLAPPPRRPCRPLHIAHHLPLCWRCRPPGISGAA